VTWPFAEFTPDQYAPVLGMLQYFDITRETILECYRRYDRAVSAQATALVPLLPRRSADSRLRIGYVSGDFRQHVMGRMMLDVIARHDRSRFSVLLVSICASTQHDAITAQFRNLADGFADISQLDDFSAAKVIGEADIDVLVDLGGHTNSSRPGIYAYKPARSIVTHLGYHGSLGMSAVDYKLTDAVADLPDAADFQIEKPYVLRSCVFPFVRTPLASQSPELVTDKDLSGKFVFAAFLNILKLSPRCMRLWRRVLDSVPEAILLFSPLDLAEKDSIVRVTASGGIDPARVAILNPVGADSALRSRYRLVHAVMDTLPYAGGDTTLAALDMGVPVVTLAGQRHSERIGASILTHLNLQELVANSEDEFVARSVQLAQDAAFMDACRQKVTREFSAAVARADDYTHALEGAFTEIASRKTVAGSMTLSSRQFFSAFHAAMRRQEKAADETEKRAIAAIFSTLRIEQPDYPPLLRSQCQLAQDMNDLALASECLDTLLRQFPGDIDARLTLAGFLIDQGNAKDALDILEDASSTGANVRILKLQARAHGRLRQWETALNYSELAVAMEPADVQVLFLHGTVLSHVGDIGTALTVLNRVLILSPNHAEAAYNAGVLLDETGNHVDAEKVFRRAIAIDPTPMAHLRLLHNLKMQTRQSDWLAEARKFTEIFPGLEYTTLLESRVSRRQGDLKREAELLLPLAEQVSQMKDDAMAFELANELSAILPCHDVSPRLIDQLHARFASASKALYSLPERGISAETVSEEGPIRLAYVADFSLPFVRDLVLALARLHDKGRFDTTVFTLSPDIIHAGSTSALVEAELVSLAGLDEDRCAKLIRARNIDVLVDVSAFGAYARPGLLSLRPAPLQLAMPGLAKPAAIGELDYLLTDHQMRLDGGSADAHPAPLFVEGCALAFMATANAAEPLQPSTSGTKSSLGIPEGATVFGVLASAEQLSSRCLALWQVVLARTPGSVLLLSPLDTGDIPIVRNILSAAGVDAARVVTLPRDGAASTQSLSGLVDIILDTLPASDYASVRTSLLEGIPLVTTAGKTAPERVALTALGNLGEVTTVAESGRDYVDIAVALANNAGGRNELSEKLKALWLEASQPGMPFSMQSYAKRMEAAFASVAGRRDSVR